MDYPAAHLSDQLDTYFGTPISDPYRWMEDLDSPAVKTWVDAQNALTQSFLADVPARSRIHARLMELVNFERTSAPEQNGGRYFFARNSGLQNQPVYFWQQGAANAQAGDPTVLLDPNTLAADGTVSVSSTSISDDGALFAYALSEAGSDLQRIHIRNVTTGEDLPDLIEWVKFSGVSWLKDSSGFFYSSYGVPASDSERAEFLKRVAEYHKVYFHKLGTPQTSDIVVFERPDDKEVLSNAGVSEDGRWLVLYQSKGHTNALAAKDLSQPDWLTRTDLIQIAPVDDATYNWIDNTADDLWLFTNKNAPNGAIVKLSLSDPATWQTVIPERTNSLESVTTAANTLILSYLVDAQTEIEIHSLDGALIRKLDLPGIGIAAIAGGRRSDDETFYTFTNYTTPATPYRLDMRTLESSVWKAPKLVFDPSLYETRQVFGTSLDGTRVPIFLTYKKTTALDGTAPTILYGYGGFSVSLGPAYASSRLAWVEMGGIYAEAILRGGGEYGETWHEAGTKLQKQNVFDDFIACAEFLIANRYTSAAKLAINGGSNGGLLVAAVSLQRPELFGAAIPQVGVLDMLRFDKFTIGYAWKPDYGSPSDNEEEFRAILKYSPLHNIHPGTRYPPTFITTADHDDRVFPAHSFKFAAAMQSAASQTPDASPVLIRVETRAGHGGGMPLSKQLDVTADMYAFLVKELSIP